MNLQNTLTKSILIFLSETFQVTVFTQKALLVATQTKQFNISLERSISFLLSQRKEMNTSYKTDTYRERYFAEISIFTEILQKFLQKKILQKKWNKDVFMVKSWSNSMYPMMSLKACPLQTAASVLKCLTSISKCRH